MKTVFGTILSFLLLAGTAAAAMRQIDSSLFLTAPNVLAMAADNEENLYFADENGGVTIVSAAGETLRVLPSAAPDGRPLLKQPRGIAVHGERIFVADAKLDRIALFAKDGSWLGSFGKGGSEPKEFDSPTAVAVCGGLLYIADSDNGRVQVFSVDGIYLATIGRSGEGEALLSEPTHLAAGPGGQIVILDDGKLKIYRVTGEFLRTIPVAYNPIAIAADGEGILLADKGTLRVVKIDYQGKELFSFGSKGKDRSQFLSITDIGITPGGRLLVGDGEKGVVHILTQQDYSPPPNVSAPLTSVRLSARADNLPLVHLATGTDGSLFGIVDGDEKFIAAVQNKEIVREIRLPGMRPEALSVAADGSLWIIDGEESRIVHLAADGKVLGSFGSAGEGDGRFDTPTDLLVSSRGLIYVADRDNERVQIFNPNGVLLHLLGGERQMDFFAAPTALALDPQGNLFVLDGDKKTISIFDPDGRHLRTFGGRDKVPQYFARPVSLAVTENEIQVLDTELGAVLVFSHYGQFIRSYATDGQAAGDLSEPTDIIVLNDNEFLIADTGNRRLQTFQMIYSPAAPAEFAGTAGQRLAILSWKKSRETYVVGYKVYRSPRSADGYREIAWTTDTFLNDSEVEPEIPYFYRVSALAKSGYEGAASESVKVVPRKVVPAPPTDLKATPQEWSIDLGWTAERPEFISEYRIYQQVRGKDVLLGTSKTTTFYDGDLDPQTTYKYSVSAVSIDGMESLPASIKATTLVTTRPPLEIAIESMDDIFSNTYKIYETDGIGKVKITNNTRDQLSHIKVAFMLKDFMDYPSEVEISNLGPHASAELVLKVVFNNLILNLTEDTTVQGEIVASYYNNENLRQYSVVQPIRIFEKHRMIWDEHERFAAFVTPKDPVVLEFGRAIASQFSEFADPILFAGVIFDSLGTTGITYLQDPSNPYQRTSENTDMIDFVQYPRETLARKSGDCDDLVGLYSAILESLGIQTQVVEVPGHMFLMFATDLQPEMLSPALVKMYIRQGERLWVPVEVTKIGSSFMKAWEAGLKNYLTWVEKLSLMDMRAAWQVFKPATLPMSQWRAATATREEIEQKFKDDLPTLRKIRLQNLGQSYLARLQTDPADANAMLQLGILYARAGEPKEAAVHLEKACALLPGLSATHNNIGNVYFMLEAYAKAEVAYRKAVELDAKDPDILINLARVQLRLENQEAARESFRRAMTIQPEITEKYRPLAINLGFSL